MKKYFLLVTSFIVINNAVSFAGIRDIKFGFQTGVAQHLIYRNFGRKSTVAFPFSLFFEHRFYRNFVGVRLSSSFNLGLPEDDLENLSAINCFFIDLPIRFYPLNPRQFFLSIGPTFVYITKFQQGKVVISESSLNRVSGGLLLSLGYDFSFGLGVDFIFRVNLKNVVKGVPKRKLLTNDLNISYNFATLF